MSTNKAILIIGACGSGKTWVMKQIIAKKQLKLNAKFGMIRFKTDKELCVLGNYDGQTFEGSDRLSMAEARDFEKYKNHSFFLLLRNTTNNLFMVFQF